MKKDRNTFFTEYGYNSMGSMPNMPNMNMMPNQTFAANSSMYSGPTINPNMNQNMYSDIDSRLSKIERQLNRLEARVSRLEGDNTTYIDETNYNANSMYMV